MATKKITNYKYNVINPQTGDSEEESLAKVMANLLLLSAAADNLKGIDQFKRYHKFFKIIREAEKTGFIEMDSKDHDYIKNLIAKEIPSSWGANENIYKVIENILNA